MTATTLAHDRTLVDWMTVTHEDGDVLQACLRGPVEAMPHGMYSYRSACRDGHGTVFAWNGPKPRPFMLILSGSALEAWRVDHPVHELVHRFSRARVHCTRLVALESRVTRRLPGLRLKGELGSLTWSPLPRCWLSDHAR